MLNSVVSPGASLLAFCKSQRRFIAMLGLVWSAFVVMEVGKGFYFNGAQTPFVRYLLFAGYLYIPWYLFSVVVGVLASISMNGSIFRGRALKIHLPVATVWALIHVLVLTSAYWVFWPERVSRVSFQFVLGEQAVKWMHFEVLAYFILLSVWRRHLAGSASNEESEKTGDGRDQLSLATESGIVRLDQEEVDWLLADDNYVIVHARDRQLRVRSTLKEMLSQLQGEQFQQAHRSAIVNMLKVREIGSQRLVLESGCRVPVSRRRHRQLLDAFNRVQ